MTPYDLAVAKFYTDGGACMISGNGSVSIPIPIFGRFGGIFQKQRKRGLDGRPGVFDASFALLNERTRDQYAIFGTANDIGRGLQAKFRLRHGFTTLPPIVTPI